MTVSTDLRAALLATETSYREIATAISVDHTQLSRFARDERGLSIDVLDRLAEYLRLELRA